MTMRRRVRIFSPSDRKPTLAKLFVCALKIPTRLDQMLHLIPGGSPSKLTVVGRSQTDESHFFGPFSVVVTTASRGAELPLPQVAEQAAKSSTMDMFVEHAVAEADGSRSSPEEVDSFWLGYLSKGDQTVDQAAFADILEKTNWLPRELQASLARLIARGAVVNLGAVGRKRTARPLHFEGAGESLRLVPISGGGRH